MSKPADETITSVTFVFGGPKSKQAAEALWIDYLDGGLDEQLEQLFSDNGIPDTQYSWDPDSRTIFISTE